MKLYTRTGDAGETSLRDGSRVAKDDARITACGEVDELNAYLGWCRGSNGPKTILSRIHTLQDELVALSVELATPPGEKNTEMTLPIPPITQESSHQLETWIDEAAANVGPLKNFVLPGGTELACRLHLARTCCRRAERSVVTLHRESTVQAEVLVYLNRLSDLLFAWARQANHESGTADIIWVTQK